MSKSGLVTLSIMMIAVFLFAGCGIPQEDYDSVVAELQEKETALSNLQAEYDTNVAAKEALQKDYDTLVAEKEELQKELTALQDVYPLNGFDTFSEFKDWISDHVQPETVWMDDAFLAAYRVQQAGMAEGYLMGLDIDTYDDSDDAAVYITVFVGNELYWWFVEDVEAYGEFDLKR